MSYKSQWGELPSEIIELILVRCPVKSLMRFMCVSKSWHETITSDKFICAQNQQALITLKPNLFDNSRLLFVREHGYYNSPIIHDALIMTKDDIFSSSSVEHLSLEFDPLFTSEARKLSLIGIANGIIALYDNQSQLYKHQSELYILWNPSICKYVTLRSSPHVCSSRCHGHGAGFWFDQDTNDYKLLRVIDCRPNIIAEIYELKKNAWRIIKSVPKHCPSGRAVWLNGALHWLGGNDIKSMVGSRPIVVFDTNEECFKEMKQPINYLDSDLFVDLELLVLGGYLCIEATRYVMREDVEFEEAMTKEIWVMKEYGVTKSWTRQNIRLSIQMTLLDMVDDMKRLVVLSDGNMMEYDLETALFSRIIQFYPFTSNFAYDHYVENLTLIDR